MCESCNSSCNFSDNRSGVGRRDFLKAGALLSSATALLSTSFLAADTDSGSDVKLAPIEKKKAKLGVVFLFPPTTMIEAGEFNKGWSTWPGPTFKLEQNQELFKEKVREFAAPLNMEVEFVEPPIYTAEGVEAFIKKANESDWDAVLIGHFWNSFSRWVGGMIGKINCPKIVYQPVGANHQYPPKLFLDTPGTCYIHSIRNWDALNGAIRSVHAKKFLSQSRVVRVSDFKEPYQGVDEMLGVDLVGIPAQEYNDLFDATTVDDEMKAAAAALKAKAIKNINVNDHYLAEAFRANKAVRGIMKRYGGDAITIRCLMLKERKPCISFSLLNSDLTPGICEDFPDSAMSMILGCQLFGRAGFMHNPEFDTDDNLYFGAHCTCPLEMRGPGGGEVPFKLRKFEHMLPETAALDLQFEPGERVFLMKYVPPKKMVFAFTGEMIGSTDFEIAGGCTSRFVMKPDNLDDVAKMYQGPHPILFYGDKNMAKWLKSFAKLCKLEWIGNV